MAKVILALNAGSSSLKFAVTALCSPEPLVRGQLDGIGTAPRFLARNAVGATVTERSWPAGNAATHEDLLDGILTWVGDHLQDDTLVAAGHRVVHGGPRHDRPARVDDALLAEMEALTPLAPLHQPHSLAPIHALRRLRSKLPQVACFDTAFHHGMPTVAARYALPRRFADNGIRRYGFHGLSYEFIAGALSQAAPSLLAGRVIVAHLGSGASLCAMLGGRSIDTTMGFTALDGLVMGTRCGSIDPGIILYLQQNDGLPPQELEDLLYRRSGLLGVSGISADMRELLERADLAAREAVELFVYRIAREAGALASSLGGLDGLVFTAGIGEHAAPVRALVCERLAWLGMRLDEAANTRGDQVIGAASGTVQVMVIPTDEEAMIARHTEEVLGLSRVQANTR